MSPAPKRIHQDLSGRLFLQIGNFLKNKKSKVYHAPFDVVLPLPNKTILQSDRIIQPDITVICNPEILDERGCHGVPDWIIEILSPGSQKHDIQLKYDLYEESCVGEYWITDPINECIEIFVLQNEKYQRIGTYFKGDIVGSHTLPELLLDLNEIFLKKRYSLFLLLLFVTNYCYSIICFLYTSIGGKPYSFRLFSRFFSSMMSKNLTLSFS